MLSTVKTRRREHTPALLILLGLMLFVRLARRIDPPRPQTQLIERPRDRVALVLTAAATVMSIAFVTLAATALGLTSHHVPQNQGVSLTVIVPDEVRDPRVTLSIADASSLRYLVDLEQDLAKDTWRSFTSQSILGREESFIGRLDPPYAGPIRDPDGRETTPAALLKATSWKLLIDVRGAAPRGRPLLIGLASRSGAAAHALATPSAEGSCRDVRLDRPTVQKGRFRIFDEMFALLPTCDRDGSGDVVYRGEVLMTPPLVDNANGHIGATLPLLTVVSYPVPSPSANDEESDPLPSPSDDDNEKGVPLAFRLFHTSVVSDGRAHVAGRSADVRIAPAPIYPETFAWKATGALGASWSLTDPETVNQAENRKVAASVLLGVATSALVASVGALVAVWRAPGRST